jgi:hypothetical protein
MVLLISRIEKATHLCLITLCLVSVALLLERRLRPAPARPKQPVSAEAFTGKHLDVPGLHWISSPLHAVLFLNTQCHFCEMSAPLYRELADLRRAHPGNLTLSVLSVEHLDVMKAFLAKESIPVDGVYRVNSEAYGLRNTPTLLIVDAHGTIQRAFIGVLDAAHRKAALEYMGMEARSVL